MNTHIRLLVRNMQVLSLTKLLAPLYLAVLFTQTTDIVAGFTPVFCQTKCLLHRTLHMPMY